MVPVRTRLTAIMNVMSWLKVYGEMECSIDIGNSTVTDLHCLAIALATATSTVDDEQPYERGSSFDKASSMS